MTRKEFMNEYGRFIDWESYHKYEEGEEREHYRKIITDQLFSGKMPQKWYQKYNEFTIKGQFNPKQAFFIFVEAYNQEPERGLQSLSQLEAPIRKARKLKKQGLI